MCMIRIKQLLLLSLLACIVHPILFARTRVPVKKEPDNLLSGPSVPPRAPSREESNIEVYIEDSYLYIISIGFSEIISYSISLEDDNTETLSGYCSLTDGEMVIDLSSLQIGCYTLSLQINGAQYIGYFAIE